MQSTAQMQSPESNSLLGRWKQRLPGRLNVGQGVRRGGVSGESTRGPLSLVCGHLLSCGALEEHEGLTEDTPQSQLDGQRGATALNTLVTPLKVLKKEGTLT